MPGRFFAFIDTLCIEGRDDDVGRKATTEAARDAIRVALNILVMEENLWDSGES
jgi:hypothetical protein